MNNEILLAEWLSALSQDLREEFEERAGILQFDGGLSREFADYASMALVCRRHPLAAQGLHLVRTSPERYALTKDLNLLNRLAVESPEEVSLSTVLAECGGLVILRAPKN